MIKIRGIIEIDANIFDQQTKPIEEKGIANLQSLRLETAYLTLQAQQNPDKVQNYLTEYQVIQDGNLSILPNVSFNFINQAQGLKTGYWANENNSEQLIGDFNGDGKDDIVNLQSDGISNNWIALSNGNGTFNLKGAYITTGSNNSQETGLIAGFWSNENNSEQLIGDFNGDGKDDIVNLQSDGISNNWVALSNGNGTFNLIPKAQGLTAGFWADENNSEQLIGDFNGDGKDDIVNLQSDGTSNNWIALSNGDGTFKFLNYSQGLTAGYWGNENNSEQLLGDFNGDGLDDIVNLQSDGTSNNWVALTNNRKAEAENILLNKYYPELNNTATLATLQQQISDQQTQTQQQIDQLKNSISQKQAEAAASISQADWYQEKSALNRMA
ncbi:MAG: VCBS repeat-containing protein [Microcystis aeruginosa Ma_AC_P_19900807_S299]|nr:MAG: VCBS repeat-containing protein [Microcystis aeruginosa Ma_AC_P_19900807_S299]